MCSYGDDNVNDYNGEGVVAVAASEERTKPVRVPADLAAMLSAIRFADRSFKPYQFLEPLIRAAIEERFDTLPREIKNLALARIDRPTD